MYFDACVEQEIHWHNPEEFLTAARKELKGGMERVAHFLTEDGSSYEMPSFYQVVNNFQHGLGVRIDRRHCAIDGYSSHIRSYGYPKGVSVGNIDAPTFWSQKFVHLPPFMELVRHEFVPCGEMKISLVPANIIEVSSSSYTIKADYKPDGATIECFVGEKYLPYRGPNRLHVLEDEPDIKRLLAIAELLLAIDDVVDQKLQTAATPNPIV